MYVLLIGILTGLFNSIFFTIEKYLFTSLKLNTNDYVLIRLVMSFLLYLSIYFIKPKLFDNTKNIEYKNIFNFNDKYYLKLFLLIVLVSILSILFWLSKNYGFDNYNINVFTTIFLVTTIVITTLLGFLLFNEKLNKYQIIGLVLAIISILLINIDKI